MQFLTPLGFFLAALAIPILLLYMLKLRRKQVQVSSTFLWVQLLRDQQANAPWQKLKRNLLLILQLLILAALVFAFARPAVQVPAVASGSVIVLLDGSASMNATDVKPSRFEQARRSVQALINGLSNNSAMTLILAAGSPQTLISAETDKSVLRQALDKAHVTQGHADWQAAFALAAGASRSSQGKATVVIVSDGGLPEDGLPALPGDVRYVPIGESQNNLSISALALRPAQKGPQLFAEASNYGESDRIVLLSIYFNNELISAKQLTLRAGSSESLTIANLSNASGVYKAQLSDPEQGNEPLDALTLDDQAFAVYQASSARRVLLVSQGNLFLEQLLASLPAVQPFRALPGADGKIQIPNDPFDLYIFDGALPEKLPEADILFVNPPSNPFFAVGAPYREIQNVKVNDHALTRFVDWSNVHILEAKAARDSVMGEHVDRIGHGTAGLCGRDTGPPPCGAAVRSAPERPAPADRLSHPVLQPHRLSRACQRLRRNAIAAAGRGPFHFAADRCGTDRDRLPLQSGVHPARQSDHVRADPGTWFLRSELSFQRCRPGGILRREPLRRE